MRFVPGRLRGCIGRRPDVAAPGPAQRFDLRAVAVTLPIFYIMTSAGQGHVS